MQNYFWSWVENPEVSLPYGIFAAVADEPNEPAAVVVQINLAPEDGDSTRNGQPRINILWSQDSVQAYTYWTACGIGGGTVGGVFQQGEFGQPDITTTTPPRRHGTAPDANCHVGNIRPIRGDLEIVIEEQVFSLSNSDEAPSSEPSVNSVPSIALQVFSPSNPALNSDRSPSIFPVDTALVNALQRPTTSEVQLRLRLGGEEFIARLGSEIVDELQAIYQNAP
ncbi:MAG: hypothetical protein HC769_27090 [Cyanobacteria bacterium CRU_2_1]|nr:hypothetical protein [Cyanobacteria bacterium CRU_2_1]